MIAHYLNVDIGDLTYRQEQVLKLVTDGYTNDQISVILGTRPQTIKNHINRAYRSMRMDRPNTSRVKRVAVALAFLGYRSLKERGMLNDQGDWAA